MDVTSLKILVVDATTDTKKVLRITPPFPQTPHEVRAWLLRQFEPSGTMSTATHELLLLDGDQRVVGPLMEGSQLYNGRRLQVKRRTGGMAAPAPPTISQCQQDSLPAKTAKMEMPASHTAAQQPPPATSSSTLWHNGVPVPQFNANAHNPPPPCQKPPIQEGVQHSQTTAAIPPPPSIAGLPHASFPAPRATPALTASSHPHFPEPPAPAHISDPWSHGIGASHCPPGPPPTHSAQWLHGTTDLAQTQRDGQAEEQRLEHMRESSGRRKEDDYRGGFRALPNEHKTQRVSGSHNNNRAGDAAQRTLEEAIHAPPNPDLQRRQKFSSPKVGEKKYRPYREVDDDKKLHMFKTILCVVDGAGKVEWEDNSQAVVPKVVRHMRKSVKKREIGGLSIPQALFEAWVRGLIVLDSSSSTAAGKKKVRSKNLNSSTEVVRVAPAFRQAANRVVHDANVCDVVVTMMKVLSTTSHDGDGGSGGTASPSSYGFITTPEGGAALVAPTGDLVAEMHRQGSFRTKSVHQVLSDGDSRRQARRATYTLSERRTGVLQEAVRLLIGHLTKKPEGCTVTELAEMLSSHEELCNQPFRMITTPKEWRSVVLWGVARELLVELSEEVVVLSLWAESMQEELSQRTSTLDLRLAAKRSLMEARDLIPVLHTHLHELKSTNGLPLSTLHEIALAGSSAKEEGQQAASFCCAIFRLIVLDIVEMRRAADGLPIGVKSVSKFDVSGPTYTLHAGNALLQSVLLSTPWSQVFSNPPQSPIDLVQGTLVSASSFASHHNLEGGVEPMRMFQAGLALFYATRCALHPIQTTPPILTTISWLTNEAKWAFLLFGTHSLSLNVSSSDINELIHFVQFCGLVTWMPQTMTFTVTPGLFDAVYYTFLMRLSQTVSRTMQTAAKHKNARRNLMPTFMDYWKQSNERGLRDVVLGAGTVRILLERARLDGSLSYDEKKERIRAFSLDDKKHYAAVCLVGSDPAVLELMKASATAPPDTPWMQMPFGARTPLNPSTTAISMAHSRQFNATFAVRCGGVVAEELQSEEERKIRATALRNEDGFSDDDGSDDDDE